MIVARVTAYQLQYLAKNVLACCKLKGGNFYLTKMIWLFCNCHQFFAEDIDEEDLSFFKKEAVQDEAGSPGFFKSTLFKCLVADTFS